MNENPKVLVVDDEKPILDIVRKILEKKDHHVSEAASGEAALEILRDTDGDFDVIILDIMMPGLNGFEVLQNIKKNPDTASIRVIMLTAVAGVKDKVKAFSSGAADYLVKPIENEELVARVRMHTEFKRMEEALCKSRKQFQQMSELSPFPICIFSPDGQTEYINPQFTTLFGYAADEIPTIIEWFDLAFPDIEYRMEAISAWKIDECGTDDLEVEVVKREYDVVCKDRSIKTVTIRTVRLDDGNTYRVFHDITHRKQSETELRETEERFRELANLLPQSVFELDLLGNLTFVNNHGLEFSGYTPDEFENGLNAIQMFILEDRERVVQNIAKRLEGTEFQDHEYTMLKKDGSTYPVLLYSNPIIHNDKPIGLRGIVLDITERKQAEEALRESEEKFREIFEHAADGILYLDRHGTIIDANSNSEHVLGYGREEVKGKNFAKVGIVRPENLQTMIERFKRAEATGTLMGLDEIEAVHKNGSSVYIEPSISFIKKDGNIEGILVVVRNVTERKRAQEEQQRLLNSLAEQNEIISKTQIELKKALNAAVTSEEVVKQKNEELLAAEEELREINQHLEDKVKLRTAELTKVNKLLLEEIAERKLIEQALRESEEHFRMIFENANDNITFMDLKGNIIDINRAAEDIFGFTAHEVRGKSLAEVGILYSEILEEVTQALDTGALGTRHEVQAKRKDGSTVYVEGSPSIIEIGGEPQGIVSIMRDVTDRKLAEEKLIEANHQLQAALNELNDSQEQLLQSAKLAAIGELISGVSHELKNPLAAISMAAEILDRNIDDKKSKKHIDIVSNHAQRAVSIVNNLLSFARKHEPNRSYVSINDAIQSTLDLLSYELNRDNIEVVAELDPNIPNTMADFNQLQHVFLNLLGNAEQAMNEAHGKGKLTIQTRGNLETIQITIADDGPGIPEAIKNRVFEPFFTTKDVGKGTGLGLSICYGIIEQHGGLIQIESKEGSGATFTIELPIIHEAVICHTL